MKVFVLIVNGNDVTWKFGYHEINMLLAVMNLSVTQEKNMDSQFVVNPLTGRLIKVGGRTYRNIMRQCVREEKHEQESTAEAHIAATDSADDICMNLEPSERSATMESHERVDLESMASTILNDHRDVLMAAYDNQTIDRTEFVNSLLRANNYVEFTVNHKPCRNDRQDTSDMPQSPGHND